MKHAKIFFFALFIIISASCCSLPHIKKAEADRYDSIDCGCRALFPEHRIQLVHSLTSILPNGDIHVAIGVTTIRPDTGTIHFAIMTIEGMVLLEAEYNRKMILHRSIPPFDSITFAQNTIDDIRLALFKPSGALIDAGHLTPEAGICRYKQENGMTIDVTTHQNGDWEIHQYNTCHKLIKTIKAYYRGENHQRFSEKNSGIPSMYEITKPGIFGYSLKLELLEARRNPS